MTNEEILEQQVEALEKLLKLKQAIIEEQEAKIQKLQGTLVFPNMPPLFPHGSNPYGQLQCPNSPTGAHQFPTLWGGTTPPHCMYCQAQQQSSLYIGSGTGSIAINNAIVSTANTTIDNNANSLAGKGSV